MALDTAKAVAKLRSLTKKFDTRVKAATPFYPRICTTVQSDGSDEEYGMLGAMPGVREWVGDPVYHKLRAGKFLIRNKDWQSGIEIEKNSYDDDRMGLYDTPIEQLALEAACHPDDMLLTDVMPNGHEQACFDGQYFYDTDHEWGKSGTQSNKLTYNAADHTVAITPAEFKAAYHQARRKMLGYTNDEGKKMIRTVGVGMKGMICMVPIELEEVAKTALYSALIGGGDSNIVLDAPEIVGCNTLTDPYSFYLHYVGGIIKPFIWQPRKPLERWTKGVDDPESKVIKFGTNARYNMGYGAWWCSVKTTFN